jgi:hypothetical protein
MKNTIKNFTILMAALSLVMLGIGSAVAGSQSNGNSIYEDGIDKLISKAYDSADHRWVASQSNGNSIYEDGIDKLISLHGNTDGLMLIARSQSNGNSIYEDDLGKLVG